MNFLKKIQSLPTATKKIILWTIVVIIALGLLIWWLGSLQRKLGGVPEEEIMESLASFE